MNNSTFKAGSILGCLCELLVGILLLINPAGFTSGIIIALGAVLIAVGIKNIFLYFRTDPLIAATQQCLVKGLVAIIAGLFCILRSDWFIATFPLLTMLYGVVILITGVAKVQWAMDLRRMHIDEWFLAALGAVLSILFAVVILMNPFSTTAVLWTFVAISLIIQAVLDIIALFFNRV